MKQGEIYQHKKNTLFYRVMQDQDGWYLKHLDDSFGLYHNPPRDVYKDLAEHLEKHFGLV